jgi:hypothetical protein
MAGFWDSLIDVLSAYQADPLTYLLIFFGFCIAAAIILPIPIEIFLVIDPVVPYPLKALVMGLGKGVGAFVVYYIGYAIDHLAHKFREATWMKQLRVLSDAVLRRSPFIAGVVGSQSYMEVRRKLRDMTRSEGLNKGALSWGWIKWLMRGSEKLVRKYGYPAMFVIMAIPGMIDTVPLYIFSILNKEGTLMTMRGFVLTNIAAGITRAAIIWLVFYIFGIEIFSVPGTG